MSQTILYSLFVAFAFSFWPIITRFGNIPAIWTAIIVNAGTVVSAIVYLVFKGDSTPNLKMIIIGIIAGLINGAGFLLYSHMLSNSNVSVSTVITVIDIMIPIVAMILGILFFKEAISVYRVLGLLLSIVGIYFILKK